VNQPNSNSCCLWVLWFSFFGYGMVGIFGSFNPGQKLRAGSGRKAQEIDGNPPEKIQQISGRNTASTSGYFRYFPVGSGDFPASFLQDPAGSSGHNLRPGKMLKLDRLHSKFSFIQC